MGLSGVVVCWRWWWPGRPSVRSAGWPNRPPTFAFPFVRRRRPFDSRSTSIVARRLLQYGTSSPSVTALLTHLYCDWYRLPSPLVLGPVQHQREDRGVSSILLSNTSCCVRTKYIALLKPEFLRKNITYSHVNWNWNFGAKRLCCAEFFVSCNRKRFWGCLTLWPHLQTHVKREQNAVCLLWQLSTPSLSFIALVCALYWNELN